MSQILKKKYNVKNQNGFSINLFIFAKVINIKTIKLHLNG